MIDSIISKWDCKACGTILTTKEVFTIAKTSSKHSFEGPKKCSCGETKSFTLIDFIPAIAEIKPLKKEEVEQNAYRQ